jgi:hypothetical protein
MILKILAEYFTMNGALVGVGSHNTWLWGDLDNMCVGNTHLLQQCWLKIWGLAQLILHKELGEFF